MQRARLSDRDDWFILWEEDKNAMLETMQANLASDLAAGYNPYGLAIMNQRNDIAVYMRGIADAYDMFKTMDETSINRWCFYDLKKRGAIT